VVPLLVLLPHGLGPDACGRTGRREGTSGIARRRPGVEPARRPRRASEMGRPHRHSLPACAVAAGSGARGGARQAERTEIERGDDGGCGGSDGAGLRILQDVRRDPSKKVYEDERLFMTSIPRRRCISCWSRSVTSPRSPTRCRRRRGAWPDHDTCRKARQRTGIAGRISHHHQYRTDRAPGRDAPARSTSWRPESARAHAAARLIRHSHFKENENGLSEHLHWLIVLVVVVLIFGTRSCAHWQDLAGGEGLQGRDEGRRERGGRREERRRPNPRSRSGHGDRRRR